MILDMMNDEQIEQIKSSTPCYVFYEQKLYETIQKLRKCCGPGVKLCFSVKSNPWLTAYMMQYTDQAEICSDGELELCNNLGINMNNVLAGGVSKHYNDLIHMVQSGVGMISIESENQLKLLKQICKSEKYSCVCLLRISSGNQFGISAEEVKRILSESKGDPLVSFAGLHYYSGTQKRDLNNIFKEMEWLEIFADQLYGSFDRYPMILEYGPGIGYPYFWTDEREYHWKIFQMISERFRQWTEKYHFVFEAGRIYVSEAGDYLTEIVDIKRNKERIYYIVDGGCHQLKYYNQSNGYRIPFFNVIHKEDKERKKTVVTVCGSLCTAGDILLRDIEMEECDIGDIFVFHNVGAYSSTEAMALFLSRKYSDIFVLERGKKLKQLFKSRILL